MKVTEHLPPDHPLNRDLAFLKPLSVVLPETNREPQKASEVTSTEVSSEQPQPQQPSSPSTLSSLEKHLGGEMCLTPQKASKTVPEQTVSENQQSEPSSSNLSEQFIPELSVPEQTVSEQPTLETQSEPEPMISSDVSDAEEELFNSSSDVIMESASDHLPTSSNSHQTSSTLAIQPFNSPKPSKIPSPPTIFLDSTLLTDVCEKIFKELNQLIQARNDLVH